MAETKLSVDKQAQQLLPVANGGTGASTFTDGGVLVGNSTGAVQSTTAGTAGQVLTSNGAGVAPTFQAPSGGGGTAEWKQGVPTGSINSSNVTFTLPEAPDTNSLILVLDGNTLDPGVGDDYTLSGNTITMNTAPTTGSKLVYFYTTSTPAAGGIAKTTNTITASETISAGDVVSGYKYKELYNATNPGSTYNINGHIGGTGVNEKLAQSFQLSTALYGFNGVRIMGRASGFPNDLVEVRIETDSAGSPSGTLLDSTLTTTFDPSLLDKDEYVLQDVFFSGSVNLSASTPYWIVLQRTGTRDTGNYFQVFISSSNEYTDGVFKNLNTSVWTTQTGDIGHISLMHSGGVGVPIWKRTYQNVQTSVLTSNETQEHAAMVEVENGIFIRVGEGINSLEARAYRIGKDGNLIQSGASLTLETNVTFAPYGLKKIRKRTAIVGYIDNTSNEPKARTLSVDRDTLVITAGSSNVLDGANTASAAFALHIAVHKKDAFVAQWVRSAGGQYAQACEVVSGTTINKGTPVQFSTTNASALICGIAADKVLAYYRDNATLDKYAVFSMSGLVLTANTAVSSTIGFFARRDSGFASGYEKTLATVDENIVYHVHRNNQYGVYVSRLSVSGTIPSEDYVNKRISYTQNMTNSAAFIQMDTKSSGVIGHWVSNNALKFIHFTSTSTELSTEKIAVIAEEDIGVLSGDGNAPFDISRSGYLFVSYAGYNTQHLYQVIYKLCENVVGVATTGTSLGSDLVVAHSGIATGLSGLKAGRDVYVGWSKGINQNGGARIGRAINNTSISVNL